MYKSIETLKTEHRSIENLLTTLEHAIKKLQQNQQIDINATKELINVIMEADQCHHGKEEDIFFVELEKRGIPKENGPIGVMLYEHQYLRKLRKIIEDNIDKVNENQESKSNFISTATEFIEILTNHILKEDNVLFKFAENVLDNDIDQKMYEEFTKVHLGHSCPHCLNKKAQKLYNKI
ncbi:MAG: hemerythrin domain-containing protein [bacterium]